MTLKPQLDKTPALAPTRPTWGELAEAGEQVNVVRFECADGAYSYPYHTFARWMLQVGEPDSLVIEVGRDRVTVCGRQLEVVRDALDAGRLRVLRTVDARYLAAGSSAVVTRITIEPHKSDE